MSVFCRCELHSGRAVPAPRSFARPVGGQSHERSRNRGSASLSARMSVVTTALLPVPPLDSRNLTISYLSSCDARVNILQDGQQRRYTLTHNDLTSRLHLTIGEDFNKTQISGWYSQLMRDEVCAEWSFAGGAALHLHCHVSGDVSWLAPARLRSYIFAREMPLVLDSIVYAEQQLFQCRILQGAPVFVHFDAVESDIARVEFWGTLRQWIDRGSNSAEAPLSRFPRILLDVRPALGPGTSLEGPLAALRALSEGLPEPPGSLEVTCCGGASEVEAWEVCECQWCTSRPNGSSRSEPASAEFDQTERERQSVVRQNGSSRVVGTLDGTSGDEIRANGAKGRGGATAAEGALESSVASQQDGRWGEGGVVRGCSGKTGSAVGRENGGAQASGARSMQEGCGDGVPESLAREPALAGRSGAGRSGAAPSGAFQVRSSRAALEAGSAAAGERFGAAAVDGALGGMLGAGLDAEGAATQGGATEGSLEAQMEGVEVGELAWESSSGGWGTFQAYVSETRDRGRREAENSAGLLDANTQGSAVAAPPSCFADKSRALQAVECS